MISEPVSFGSHYNFSTKFLYCYEVRNCCCILTPISYDLNIFSQDYVPIYECEGIEQKSNLEVQNGTLKPSVNSLRFDFDYSQHNFPNDIWIVRDTWEIAVKTTAVIPLVILAIFGNLAVIKIILTKKAMRKNPVNLFIFNMSIADLLCALLFPWIFLISDFYQVFVLGPFICKFEGFVLVTLMLTSVFTLTVISFDRLVSIVFPFNCRLHPKSAKWIIVVIWIVASGISSPLFIYRTYKERQWKDFYETWCTEDVQKLKSYWLVLAIVLIWVPLTVLTISYSAIVIKLDTLEKRQHNQPISQIKHKSKVIRMLFIVVLAFSICWIPFTVVIFVRNNFNDTEAVEVTGWFRTLFFVSHYLMFLNSAINPIIYGLMNDNFKRELRSQGCSACMKKRSKIEVSTVLPNGRVGGNRAAQDGNLERNKLQTMAAKYGLVLSTTSASVPSLSAFDRRNSALIDLGLPVPIAKEGSSSDSFTRLNYEMFRQ